MRSDDELSGATIFPDAEGPSSDRPGGSDRASRRATLEGIRLLWPGLLASLAAASLIDATILRLKKGYWEFPSGAILSALLVTMVLSPRVPWYETACAAAIAVLSKYAFRTKSANVFNPAALALVIVFYVFRHRAQNWWGALPGLDAVRASGPLRDGHLHHRPGKQAASGAGIPGRLLPALFDHGFRHKSCPGGRDFPAA